MSIIEWTYQEEKSQRVDSVIASALPEYSRSTLKKWIKAGQIKINEETIKPNYLLKQGDNISVQPIYQEEIKPVSTPMPLDIRYEDDDVLVINKPQGLVVHPAKDHENDTLVNGLLAYSEEKKFTLPQIGKGYRPGIVHRIDKDTSGLLVIAKTNASYYNLSEQVNGHHMSRLYTALVYGKIPEEKGTINLPLKRNPMNRLQYIADRSGKSAMTHFTVLEENAKYSLLRLRLETGRTHQIRAHMMAIGHPIVDDPLYAMDHSGQFFDDQGQLLHAGSLTFRLPSTGEEITIHSELPEHFNTIIQKVGLSLL